MPDPIVKLQAPMETSPKDLMVAKTFLKIFKSRSRKYFVVQDHKMPKKKSPAAAVVKVARYLKLKFKVKNYILAIFVVVCGKQKSILFSLLDVGGFVQDHARPRLRA